MAPKSSLVLLAAALLLVAAVGQVRGALGPLLSGVTVTTSGIVPCSIGSNINVTAVPPFANATVQVMCGSNVLATTTTSATGAFSNTLGSILSIPPALLTSMLSGVQCRVVVVTPLVACNVSLAGVTGTLTSPLQLLNSTTGGVGGILTTTNILGFTVTTVNGVIIFITGLFSFIAG